METFNSNGTILIPIIILILTIVGMAILTYLSPRIHHYRLAKRIKRDMASGVEFVSYDPAAALNLSFTNPATKKVTSVRNYLIETLGISRSDERGYDRGASFGRDPAVALVALLVREGYIDGHLEDNHNYVEWNTADFDEFMMKMVAKV